MTKFSNFIRAPGTAGPPTREGIHALGFALRSDFPVELEKYLWLGGAQAFTGGEKTQGRANLGVVIGTDVQAYDAALQSIAGLTTVADQLPYTTGPDTYAVTALTPFARTMLDDANASAVRTTIGLGNVDNTSDANKPISTATQTALDLKAPLASPAFTGNPTAPTAAPGDNDTTVATTAFVAAAVAAVPAAFALLQEITPSTTAIDFTGLPANLRQMLLVLDDVVTSGLAQMCVRLGNSGGFISTGYTEGSIQVAPGGNSSASLSTGISLTASTASNTFKGGVYFVRVNTNDWVAYGVIGLIGGSVLVAGRLALTGTLTQLRLTTTGGTVTFSGAKVSLFGA